MVGSSRERASSPGGMPAEPVSPIEKVASDGKTVLEGEVISRR
jgi:hypothetical protein